MPQSSYSLTFLVQILNGLSVLVQDLVPVRIRHARLCDHDQIEGSTQKTLVSTEQGPHPPLHPVPLDGVADFLAGDRRHPGIVQVIGEIDEIEISSSVATAILVDPGEIALSSYPLLRPEGFGHQTASLFLPF